MYTSFGFSVGSSRLRRVGINDFHIVTKIINQTKGDSGQLDVGIGTRLRFIAHNRARGILLETRNVAVKQCLFNRTSASAVYIQPSLLWYEGPVAYNITLTQNIYINCNQGIGQLPGVINLSPYSIQSIPVIEYFHIRSSTFINAIDRNVNQLLFMNNYIATNASTPLISIYNSQSLTAVNNAVVNNQSTINQYYTFDKKYPCLHSLSRLINLTVSAFNSSFTLS
ncbi:hypothetical protein I4U23_003792 [Adineta vaga]|nr:hypothetical protein I4U23_003792 [Adineta vaga]